MSAAPGLPLLTARGVLREAQVGKKNLVIHLKLMRLLADDGHAFALDA